MNGAICKGCYALGSACGQCRWCVTERVQMHTNGLIAESTDEAARAYYRRQRPSYNAPSNEELELNEKLQAQALQDPKLRTVLELMHSYPMNGASERRILLTALLEFSRHALIMQKLAAKVLELSPVMTRLSLPSLLAEAEQEVHRQ